MTVTVISHFYNEQYLLPWWLQHHVGMFDHGVLIDYASTDNSIAICRELAPDWEILPSRNGDFGAQECDREVMDVENAHSGWKICLNTTEFLCGDLTTLIDRLESEELDIARLWAAAVVDQDERDDIDPSFPLVTQCHFGTHKNDDGHQRTLHRMANGAYGPGRHVTYSAGRQTQFPPEAMVLWFQYAPWTPEFRARKLQIQHRIPERDRVRGFGFHHHGDEHQLFSSWHAARSESFELQQDEHYARIFGVQ